MSAVNYLSLNSFQNDPNPQRCSFEFSLIRNSVGNTDPKDFLLDLDLVASWVVYHYN